MSRSYSEFVVPLIRSLRGEILAAYGQVDHVLKNDLSVVTEIDKQVEQKLIDALTAKYPEIGFHGEEHGKQGPTDKYWLIDPIDGTENYVRGLPGVTTIVGLVEDGEVTQSYIYDPVEDAMYSAFKGMGAFKDDEPIHVSDRDKTRAFLVVGSRSFQKLSMLGANLKAAGLHESVQVYGSGIKSVYLASGKVEGIVVFEAGGGPWDHLPTRFLAQEAGAHMTLLETENSNEWSFILLNPKLQTEMLPVILETIDAN